ncbi:hypothetical protein LCGC14_2745750 [marine sediment metagenome]|uniref:Uncharacterized protein n=1 Tax=marine sediment metagenome TaxID=412755 RepID=A0A0F8ZQ97_9ZZZZ
MHLATRVHPRGTTETGDFTMTKQQIIDEINVYICEPFAPDGDELTSLTDEQAQKFNDSFPNDEDLNDEFMAEFISDVLGREGWQ